MQILGHRKCMIFGRKSRNSLIYSSSTEIEKMQKAGYNPAGMDGEQKKHLKIEVLSSYRL